MSEPHVKTLFDLRGRTAVVTGATGHLGTSMSMALAEAGARVIAVSRSLEKAATLVSMLPDVEGEPHLPFVMELFDEDVMRAQFAELIKTVCSVDILINNAHQPTADDWTTIRSEAFNQQLEHATSYFNLSRLFRDHIVSRAAQGSIIMIGSMYGNVASYPDVYDGLGSANPVAYQVLKAGIAQMVKHLAVYWAADGIRVNCISPGPFPRDGISTELKGRIEAKSPMKRVGSPHELKGAAVFFASDASSYITGQELLVDGGWTAW